MPIAPSAEEITLLTPVAKATAEKFKAINPDALAKFTAAESAMGEEVKETAKATFGAADTNNDGLLVEAEYVNFTEMMLGNYKAAYGDAPAHDEEGCKGIFAVLNQITPGAEGVSTRDLIVAHAVLLAAIAGEI